MKGLMLLLVHVIAVLAQLAWPGGIRGLVAENLIIKRQLLVLSWRRREHGISGRSSDPCWASVRCWFGLANSRRWPLV